MITGVVVVSSFWTDFFSAGKASAVTIFPFILIKSRDFKSEKMLINHERIHIQQAFEMLVLPFYLLYLLEFLLHYFYFRDFKRAYFNISFEREAYKNQHDLNYCNSRGAWAFLKYFRYGQ